MNLSWCTDRLTCRSDVNKRDINDSTGCINAGKAQYSALETLMSGSHWPYHCRQHWERVCSAGERTGRKKVFTVKLIENTQACDFYRSQVFVLGSGTGLIIQTIWY